jgi:hypothetical protein
MSCGINYPCHQPYASFRMLGHNNCEAFIWSDHVFSTPAVLTWQGHSLILATKIDHQRTSEGTWNFLIYIWAWPLQNIYTYGPTVTRTGKTSSAHYQGMAEVIRIMKTSDSTNTLTGTDSWGWCPTYNWVHGFWNIRPPDSQAEKCETLI